MNPPTILRITRLTDTSDQALALEEIFESLAADLTPEVMLDLQEAVILREETSPTYLEDSLAVPHGRISSLNQIVICVGLNNNGIDWPVEGTKARVIIMVGVPAPMVTGYLKILQKIIKWHKATKLVQPDGSIPEEEMPALERELKAILGLSA